MSKKTALVFIPRFKMEEIERALRFDRRNNKKGGCLSGVSMELEIHKP